MILGLKTCHGPFTPPPRNAKDYEGALARSVPNYGIPPIYAKAGPNGPKGKATDAKEVSTNLGMFRGINSVDDNVGKLLKVLDDLKLTEDTVFVFSSDNGYYLGEHNLGDKRTAYEESMRIPMLVRYPRGVKAGRTEDRMVLNIDPAATFLDLAGQPVPTAIQGRSWKPLMEGRDDAAWRDSFFYCYFYEKNFGSPMTTAVRTADAKLIKYPGHDEWTEVFDLKVDPYEIKNLAADPAYADLRKKLEAEYDKQAKAIDFKIPDYADKPAADGQEGTKKKAGKKKAK
jgi:arylsulfatase A-like enzyme